MFRSFLDRYIKGVKLKRKLYKIFSSHIKVSFWVDSDSVPARVALGITTVLAMTTLMFGVQSALPKVPYMKAVDLFLAFSFICVFAALVEFAAVNYHVTNAQKVILQKKRERRKVLREKCKRVSIIYLIYSSILFYLFYMTL